jgi:hypothetical protein
MKIYLPACLFLIAVRLMGKIFSISTYDLTADPAEIAGKLPYIGFFSNVGNLLWCGAAAICIFTAFLTKVDQTTARRWFIFLLASFFLTVSLLLDDLFQIHEYYHAIFFAFQKVDVPLKDKTMQNIFELLYMCAMYLGPFGLYIFYFRKYFRHTEYLYFILAIFFFTLSIVIDMTPETLLPEHFFIEDGAKLLGIFSWLTYFYRTCNSIMRQLIAKLALHPDQG